MVGRNTGYVGNWYRDEELARANRFVQVAQSGAKVMIWDSCLSKSSLFSNRASFLENYLILTYLKISFKNQILAIKNSFDTFTRGPIATVENQSLLLLATKQLLAEFTNEILSILSVIFWINATDLTIERA